MAERTVKVAIEVADLPAVQAVLREAIALSSVAGDLWNLLENMREHWQDLPECGRYEEAIATYEAIVFTKRLGELRPVIRRLDES